MGAPVYVRNQTANGRTWDANFQVAWDQTDSGQLSDVVLVSILEASGKVNDPRFAVTTVEWQSSGGVAADVFFDSVPPSPAGMIVNITPDSGNGRIDFTDRYQGGIPDPNREGPGNIVLTTRNALPGDELWIRLTGVEKGNTRGK